MKKINSNGYAHKIVGVAVILLVVIPACFCLISSIVYFDIFSLIIRLSYTFGIVTVIFLFGLLMIEFAQDGRINKYYEKNKNRKLILDGGMYECQACGNRQVKHDHKSCVVCGIHFHSQGE